MMDQPEKKKTYFIVTVDTEEEWDWAGSFPVPPFSLQNLKRIPKFQEFCERMGIVPTYFLDYPVLHNEECVTFLKSSFEKGQCDLGAHLHPWATPPLEEQVCNENSYLQNLPVKLFRNKLELLTGLFEEKFAVHPFSFRSGRWGMAGHILQQLADIGYLVDSSIRPYYDDMQCSYFSTEVAPFWPDFTTISEHGKQRKILEFPVSSGFSRANFELFDPLYRVLAKYPLRALRLNGILWRLRVVRKIYITPEGHSGKDIISCIKSNLARGNNVINLFFHSSDLMPGNTSYVKDANDEREFYNTLKEIVDYLAAKCDVEFCSIRSLYEKFVTDGVI